MKTRLLSIVVALALLLSCVASAATISTAAASTDLDFTFGNGKMSEKVLRNYLSRAVTYMGLCAEGNLGLNNIGIEEDVRFLLRTGTKFVSRAALFAWACTSASEVEKHFEYAKTNAAKVHAADKEIILQAFVAEIVRKSYVNGIKIPAWVFEAFGEKVEDRNFIFEDMINVEAGPNHWGSNAGYPDWSRPEGQRWYYYCIRRYIDCGFESIHIQEASCNESTGQYDPDDLKACDKVLTMSREYAKKSARRGIVLFHNFFPMAGKGSKIGNRLVFDINGNGLVPNETKYNEDEEAYECQIATSGMTWFGRSRGGEHPLGFTCETVPTLLEFDNYGPLSHLQQNVNNGPNNFGTWGYDDITWFATQPEAYRNKFLKYLDNLVKTEHLSKKGEQQYYILYPGRRCITPQPNYPVIKYTPGELIDADYLLECGTQDRFSVEVKSNIKGTYYLLTCNYFYRANRNSDGCPVGFNQEDTIREIFLGKNAKEDPKWDTIVVKDKSISANKQSATTTKTTTTTKKDNNKTTVTDNKTTAVIGGSTTVGGGDSLTTAVGGSTTTVAGGTDVDNNSSDISDTTPDVSTDVDADTGTDATPDSGVDTDVSTPSTDDDDETGDAGAGTSKAWVFIVIGVVAAAAATGAVLLILQKRKKAS